MEKLLRNTYIGKPQDGKVLEESQYQFALDTYIKDSNDTWGFGYINITFLIHHIGKYRNPDGSTYQKPTLIGEIKYDYYTKEIEFSRITEDYEIILLKRLSKVKFNHNPVLCEREMYENERFVRYVETLFNLEEKSLLFDLMEKNNKYYIEKQRRQIAEAFWDLLEKDGYDRNKPLTIII